MQALDVCSLVGSPTHARPAPACLSWCMKPRSASSCCSYRCMAGPGMPGPGEPVSRAMAAWDPSWAALTRSISPVMLRCCRSMTCNKPICWLVTVYSRRGKHALC